jgi:hypothetical protein
MAEIASAFVSLIPSARGFGAAVNRQIDPQGTRAGDRFGSQFTRGADGRLRDLNGRFVSQSEAMGSEGGRRAGSRFSSGLKSVVGPAIALLGTAAIGSFLRDSIGEAREAQKVGALTESIIKSTGGAAKITADQVGDLATKISLKTGMDDEAIQSGANLLLTFKNVRNEAGRGAKIFDRATAAAADLSAAGFGDLAGTSKQLGKALNDPIKGISALGRSGVTFTEDQKKMIKGFVAQGDVLSAQKIILKEVESQVGGAAAATATSGEKAAVAFGNLKEAIGTALLPVVDRVATYLTTTFIPALYKIPAIVAQFRTYLAPVIAFFQSFINGSGQGGAKIEGFRATVMTALVAVQSIFRSTVSIVTSLWARFGGIITSFLQNSMTNVLTILRGAFDVVSGIFKTVAALLKGDWKGAWDGIKQILRGALTVIQGIIKQGFNIVKSLVSAAGTAIKAAAKGAFNGLKEGAQAGWAKLKTYVQGIPGKIKDAFSGATTLLTDIGGFMVDGLKNGLSAAWHKVTDFVDAGVKKIPKAIRKLMGIASPSKVTTKLGEFIGQGLVNGLRNGTGGMDAYLKEVTTKITDSLKLRKVELKRARPGASKKQRARVSAYNDRERKSVAKYNEAAKKAVDVQKAAVDQLAKSLSGLGGRIDQAKSDLKGLQDARASLADQTASSISGELSLAETGGKKLSFATIAGNVSGLKARAMAFAGKLRALLAAGIPAGLVQEVASLGTVAGIGVANALLSGSQQQIGQLAADYAGIDTYSKQIGDVVAGSMYDAGIRAQEGLLNGLLNDAQIQLAANKLGSKLTKAVKKALGIKSPSRVFQNEVGKYIPAGVVAGIDDGQRALDRRVAGMVSVAKIGKVQPGDFDGGVAASGAPSVTQNIYPQPKQTEQEIGNASANRIMWAMS